MSKAEIQKLAKKSLDKLTPAEWDARSDAYTLSRAELVKSDPARLKKAKVWAEVLLLEEKAETEAMRSVADA